MLFRILLWSFILVMIFRFVVRFVLPILQITRTAQSKIRQMQQQMEEMQRGGQKETNSKAKVVEGDYIEYEEVK